MAGSNACIKCSKPDHHVKDCKSSGARRQGQGGQVQVALRANRFYALHAYKEVEKTLDVVIDMLKIYDFDVYTLLDPRANLSFVTPFLANRFHACSEVLNEPFKVCTPVGESIVTQRVCRGYLVSILHKVISCDLIELSMDNLDVIPGMD